jgi:hypothetical protein
MLGYENGADLFTTTPNSFVPGAMADSLTSFGGMIYETSGQISLLAFLNAGATASFGTVLEPCAYLEKFPNSRNYFYQARGFSIAECYYMSVTNPYQGLIVGEPLSAPFAQPPNGSWLALPAVPLLSGTTNLSLQAVSSDGVLPVQQVDLFLDGIFLQTLTNISPRLNNVLNINLNGHSMNYTVGNNETLRTVASGVASLLNVASNTNATKVSAFAHGDRLELRSFDLSKAASNVSLSVGSSIGTAAARTTFVDSAGTNFLEGPAYGIRSYFVTNTPALGDYLQLTAVKTNGQTVVVSVTNTIGGTILADFARTFFGAVNTNSALQSADGIVVEDINMHEDPPYAEFVYGLNDHSGEFNIRARSAGWAAARVQVRVSGSATFGFAPTGTNRLDENVGDLQPRSHLYVSAGATNLPVTFGFNTTTQANGLHELTAVIYEGTHVRTQRRLSQPIQIQNGNLAATFTILVGSTNSALEGTLEFQVAANTNNVLKIELFSTGGAVSNVLNQSTANFSVAGTNLGPGLHPFYAVVTTSTGKQYRTETKWIRLVTGEPGFNLSVTSQPVQVSWPATAGRRYEILSATNASDAFVLRDSIMATNSVGQWVETNSSAPQRFYRVRTAD